MLLFLGMGGEEIKFYLGPNWRKIRKIIRRGKEKFQFNRLSRAAIFWGDEKPLFYMGGTPIFWGMNWKNWPQE
jgi:hypothetical protein